MRGILVLASLVALAGTLAAPPGRLGLAQTVQASAEFTREYLSDSKNIAQGKGVWQTRCQFCHGKAAYPGKAPKLEPPRYTAQFVYDRVTNGFRGMPPWRQEFSEQELRAVVAYVLSKEFSN